MQIRNPIQQSSTAKEKLTNKHPKKCDECYKTEWNNKPIELELCYSVDNKKPNKLQFLCPICIDGYKPWYVYRMFGDKVDVFTYQRIH